MSDDQWRADVEEQRERKEEYFAEDPRSPVADGAFAGLDHYPPDPDYRYELPMHEHDDKEVVVVETTAGNRSSMLEDVSVGRRTEIDATTDYVVGAAEVPVPVNETLASLVRAVEAASDPG